MSEAENDADVIKTRLTDAGWTGPPEGTLSPPSFHYDNGQMTIDVERERDKRELLVTFTSDGGELTVYPVYGDRLEETLAALVAMQDTVRDETLQSSIAQLVHACPEVYVQREDDDEPMLLEDDLSFLDPDRRDAE